VKVIKFAPGLVPVLKHQEHDQSSHGNWADGSQNSVSELSDDEIRGVIYNSKTVDEMFHKVAKRLGKSMKPSVANLSEDEITHYRGVPDVSRDAQRLLDGKIKFTEFQTWGQGIYLAEEKSVASNYGTLMGLKLDSSAKMVKGETAWDSAFEVSYENPSARTRNTTTSDFIDLSRIETQIRAGKMDNLSISDMRNVYWAAKGYDGFTTYGETVLFNGSKLTVNKADIGTAVQKHSSRDVLKHGEHDQSSHGNWADGNFNEELQEEDLQNEYFDRYGITTSAPKEPVGVTMEEIEAVNKYSGDGFRQVNGLLRGTSPGVSTTQDTIDQLDKVIEGAPVSFGDTNLYRVYERTVLSGLEEGAIMTDKGFLSTTRVDLTDENYKDVRDSIGLIADSEDIVAIILPNATKSGKGLAVDSFKNAVQDFATGIPNSSLEREVLLPRSTPLKFIGYKRDVGMEAEIAVFQRMDDE
jgi:hypothetical protein